MMKKVFVAMMMAFGCLQLVYKLNLQKQQQQRFLNILNKRFRLVAHPIFSKAVLQHIKQHMTQNKLSR